jgi:Endoplasmic reticulum-based factor for assembly of V-ATPase
MLLENLKTSTLIDHKSLKTLNPKEYKLSFPKLKPLKKTNPLIIENAYEVIYKRENGANYGTTTTTAATTNTDIKQLMGLLNVLISIVGVLVSVFYLGELIHLDLGLRILVALMIGLVVAFAEIWFYSRDLRNFD